MKIHELECPNCGAKIKPNQKFCEYCGTSLHIELEKPTQSENPDFSFEQKRSSFTRQTKVALKTQLAMSIVALIMFTLFTFGMAGAIIATSSSSGGSAFFAFFPLVIGLGADAGIIVSIVGISKAIKSKKDDDK